jgi:DNA/RNA-binding domain of Phe-tRNA-synthetase-like protein
MTMRVADQLHQLGLTFAAVSIEGITVREMTAAERNSWQARSEAVRETFVLRPVTEHAEIAALHAAYAALGIGLRHGRPSIERMGGMLAKGRDMPVINIVADLYNIASLEHRLCMGAHDLDSIVLPVDLRLTTGEETFKPLGGEAEKVRPGEFAYVDAANRIICRLDALQADFSKVSRSTRRVLLIVEASSATTEAALIEAAASVSAEIATATGGEAEPPILATPTPISNQKGA